MSKMGVADAIFFEIETPQAPMHVAALIILRYPEGRVDSFVPQMMARYLSSTELKPPFNLKPKFHRFKMLLPSWERVPDVNIRDHVYHCQLPKPGNREQLLDKVARLHELFLDESKPMWEYHIIEGLDNGCFALYFKMHHAYLDGVAGMSLIKASFRYDADSDLTPPWEPSSSPQHEERRKKATVRATSYRKTRALWPLVKAISNVGKDRVWGRENPRPLPYMAPESLINGRLSEQRSIAVTSLPADEIKEAAKKAKNASRNDIVLAVCSGALHSYLKQKNALPQEPLIGFIPVSVRTRREIDLGNRVGNVLCNLGTHLDDPIERLRVTQTSMDTCKAYLQEIPSRSFQHYTILKNLPLMTIQVLGLTERIRPPFNIVISNIPGPKRQLYFNGASVESIYPVSALINSQGLNVTVISYVDTLHIGLVGCRRLIPDLEQFAWCIEQEFEVLKQHLGI